MPSASSFESLFGQWVNLDPQHSFFVEFARFEQTSFGYVCTLRGEYFHTDSLTPPAPYNPPRYYSLEATPVFTKEIARIVPHPHYIDPFGELERLLNPDC